MRKVDCSFPWERQPTFGCCALRLRMSVCGASRMIDHNPKSSTSLSLFTPPKAGENLFSSSEGLLQIGNLGWVATGGKDTSPKIDLLISSLASGDSASSRKVISYSIPLASQCQPTVTLFVLYWQRSLYIFACGPTQSPLALPGTRSPHSPLGY